MRVAFFWGYKNRSDSLDNRSFFFGHCNAIYCASLFLQPKTALDELIMIAIRKMMIVGPIIFFRLTHKFSKCNRAAKWADASSVVDAVPLLYRSLAKTPVWIEAPESNHILQWVA